jgi:hypothetical protein
MNRNEDENTPDDQRFIVLGTEASSLRTNTGGFRNTAGSPPGTERTFHES